MKNGLLSLFALLLATGLTAQVVFVNAPESIKGSYDFAAAAFGADISSDVWTADAIFVDDGSANPTQGCNEPMNAADLAGKIALIDRGSCEFGVKCLNAENAGAIAVIVFNNQPGQGAITMGAGSVGGQVTIPCVMLSYEDGQTIREALQNETVNITIGALRFNNDIGSDRVGLSNPPLGVVPASQLDFFFTPGVAVTNRGLVDATNVTVNGIITQTPDGGSPTEVYNESATLGKLQVDSTEFIELLPFDPAATGKGFYEISYDITSDSLDELPSDNQFTSTFYVSDNLFNKGEWNIDEYVLRITNAFTISGGGNIMFMSGFHVQNATSFRADSVIFWTSTSNPSLDGIKVEALLYTWEDANGDGTADTEELLPVAFAEKVFDDTVNTGAWVRIPLLDLVTFEEGYQFEDDDVNVFVAVRYEGADLVFFGFDTQYDYQQFLNLSGDNLSDLDLPYIGVNVWDGFEPDMSQAFLFTGLTSAVATTLVITDLTTDVKDVLPEEAAQIRLFPNPAADHLIAEVQLEQPAASLEYRITDAQGRLVWKERLQQASFDKVQISTAALPNGQYFFTIQTDQGFRTKAFTVQH